MRERNIYKGREIDESTVRFEYKNKHIDVILLLLHQIQNKTT